MTSILRELCGNTTAVLSSFDDFYNHQAEKVLSVMYTIVGSMAVLGNIFALYFFLRIDTSRLSSSKIFYSGFAVTDLIAGIGSLACAYVFARTRPLYFCSTDYFDTGSADFFGMIQNFPMLAGPNIVALMSLSRCISVLKPFTYKFIFTTKICCIGLAIACLHPLIFSLLPFFVSQHYSLMIPSGQFGYQLFMITGETDLNAGTPTAHYINLFLLLIPRLSAILLMTACSGIVAVVLFLNRGVSATREHRVAQTQASITLVILAVIYFLTYAPFCFLIILDYSNKNLDVFNISQYMYFVPWCYLIAYFSGAVNPLVYHLRGKRVFGQDARGKGTVYANNHTKMSVIHENNKVQKPPRPTAPATPVSMHDVVGTCEEIIDLGTTEMVQ